MDPVAPSSSGLCQPFARSVRRKGKVSLEIVVPSTASRVGPANNQHPMKPNNNNRNNDTSNVPAATRKSGVHNNNNAATSPVITCKSGINNNKAASPTRKSGRQSNKLAQSGVKSSSSVDRGVGVKSSHDSFSSSSSASEDDAAPAETSCRHKSKRLHNSTAISVPPSSPPVSVAQVLPSPVDSVASAEAMEEEVDVCLTGASVIDPVAPEEFLPVAAVVAPSAAPAVVVNVSASPWSVVEDDNAATQDCPSWPISSPQSEPGTYLATSQSLFQDGSLGSLFDDPGDVSASSTCTSSGDQAGADRLQELLGELHAESTDSDVEPALPQH